MKRTIINAEGYEIEVRFGGKNGDFVSLTDIARYKTSENMSSKTGCAIGIRFVSLAFGNSFTIQFSIASNSRQLKTKLE